MFGLNKMCQCIVKTLYKLKEFIAKYNNYRPHRELDHLTPMEYYSGRVVKMG
jgi:transposase InsO family protein